ncbi:Aste57867_23352 [Aphanomyces stellatus]|uniref:Aste57867_23352 protein n=1 Tax=Aphanomyces stellatus TaxID=120398 RepID=A0A485LNA5_9STRA|nr:hypothetical protein As57867_023281 [Aphanomyces stellatus]VFT99997.1 Aste57867_23352 [Aphanomyces stellatus]
MQRLRMDLHAKKEQCEALERDLEEAKDDNERLDEELSRAQQAWDALEHEFQVAKDTHEQQSQDFRDAARSWEAKLVAERAQHAKDVERLKAKLERFHAQADTAKECRRLQAEIERFQAKEANACVDQPFECKKILSPKPAATDSAISSQGSQRMRRPTL